MKTYNEFVNDLLESKTFTHELNKSVSILIKWLTSYHLKHHIDKNESTQDFQLTIFNDNNFDQDLFEIILTIVENFGYFPSLILIDDRNLFTEYKEYKHFKNVISNDKRDIGYINFLKSLTFDNCEKIYFQFERYKDLDVELDDIPDVLYHVCKEDGVSKIKRDGLVPKSKSKISYHPDRIYLTENGAKSLIDQFKKLDKFNYISLPIYLNSERKRHIQLKKDPNFDDGYYTLTNIPPEWFKII